MERTVRGDGGSVLRVLYQDPQHIRSITDPFVGDTISLVTGFGPPRGLLKPQKFVDLEALSSAQGIALATKSDGVKIKILGDDVIIEKDGGLALSNRICAAAPARSAGLSSRTRKATVSSSCL
jgi:hypothetical protein